MDLKLAYLGVGISMLIAIILFVMLDVLNLH